MKIIDLLNKIANGEEVPKKIKYNDEFYWYDETDDNEIARYRDVHDEWLFGDAYLNDEVEILEDTNEITAEQIMMATDTLNRLKPTIIEATRNYNKAVEAIKNHFNTLENTSKEEKKIPEKLGLTYLKDDDRNNIIDKINEIIDYLKSKGDE